MKRVLAYLIPLLFLFQSSLLSYSSNPTDFVKELVNDAIIKLSDKSLTNEQKRSLLNN